MDEIKTSKQAPVRTVGKFQQRRELRPAELPTLQRYKEWSNITKIHNTSKTNKLIVSRPNNVCAESVTLLLGDLGIDYRNRHTSVRSIFAIRASGRKITAQRNTSRRKQVFLVLYWKYAVQNSAHKKPRQIILALRCRNTMTCLAYLTCLLI